MTGNYQSERLSQPDLPTERLALAKPAMSAHPPHSAATAHSPQRRIAARFRIQPRAQHRRPPAHGGNLHRGAGTNLFGNSPHHRVGAMNKHQPRHVHRVFVMRNHHRQKVGVRLAGVAGAVHVLHHAGHTGVHVGLEAACLRFTASRFVTALVPERQGRDCRYIDDVRGAALAAELGCLYVHCDVGDKAQVDTLLSQTIAAHGRIDVLVNNAGIFKAADFLDISEDDFDAVLRINLRGSFPVGQAVARATSKAEAKRSFGGSPSRGASST